MFSVRGEEQEEPGRVATAVHQGGGVGGRQQVSVRTMRQEGQRCQAVWLVFFSSADSSS